MFNKFFKFLLGYVIIRIYGKDSERFVNICLRRNIQVWNVKPCDGGIELCIYRSDFFQIRSIAKKCRVRVRIKEKRGLLHMMRLYKKRYIFPVCALLCVVFFTVSAQFIWLVEINGVERSDIDSIVETLNDLGIKSGALKRNIPDGTEIKRAIINGTDGIAWAWVYIEGAKARVEISEQIIPPEIIDKDTPCDIVAACDGVIERMVVKSGEEGVRVGDAVKAGDVLVSAKVPVYKEWEDEQYMYVHSIAEVQADTTLTMSGDYKLYYESRLPTGKRKTRIALEVFGKVFPLPAREITYEDYDSEESRHELYIPFFGYTGIALDTVTYSEVSVNREPLSIETAVEFAKNELEEKISEKLISGSVLKDEKLEYTQTDNETINVKLEMNFTQNIAVEQPLGAEEDKGEEIFDKQTDRSTAGG